jgi:hypothetical protein
MKPGINIFNLKASHSIRFMPKNYWIFPGEFDYI